MAFNTQGAGFGTQGAGFGTQAAGFSTQAGLGFQTQDGLLSGDGGNTLGGAGLTEAFHDFGTSQADSYLQFTDFGHVRPAAGDWLGLYAVCQSACASAAAAAALPVAD